MAFRWYQTKLITAPLLTQSLSTAFLFAVGDVMAQQGVDRQSLEQQDFARTGRMIAYGGAVFGPVATKWYGFLVRKVNFNSANTTIAARVACDQLLFAPANMALFFSSMAYLEGVSPKERLEKAYIPGLTKNYMVWPWVQYANFKYVPMEHRVLFVNFLSLGWNCYLSYLNSANDPEEPVIKEGVALSVS